MTVSQESVSATVIRELERQLLFGEICPGRKLPSQRRLAVEMGVSRSSVREAVTELQSRGLVETWHGGGSFSKNLLEEFYLQPMPGEDAEQGARELQFQVMEARELLEGEAAWFAARRATDQQLQAISAEYQRMLERGVGDTTLKKARADLRFHMLIAESSHNLLIMSISQVMYAKYFNAIYGVLSRTLQKTGKYPPRIGGQHARIYQALMDRDGEAARKAAVEHMRYTRQQLSDSYKSQL